MKQPRKEGGFLAHLVHLIDRFSGDKVFFLIALFLMLISVISVFSSSPLLVSEGSDRVSIMVDQLKVVGLGFLLMFGFYFLGRPEWYKKLSKLGFLVSFLMLAILVLNLNLGLLKAGEINGARRILLIAGKQLHVYEFVKLFMIMYLGWALDTYKNHGFKWAPRIAARNPRLAFLEKDVWQKILYIYTPLLITTCFVMMGSNSSALFIGGIMVVMVVVGGLDFKDVAAVVAVGLVIVGLLFGAHKIGLIDSGNRFATFVTRITNDDDATMKILMDSKRESLAWRQARGKLYQPVGALLAIKEGGVLGKGIGNSTQKYQVPVIYGDYMFSFIVEETGLWGAFILIVLYFSLMARGTMVAKECDNYYDKIIVTGLTILVTGQAFMHMAVNVHLPFVPQTGQTLPLVSHGSNSFIAFAMVFGILMSISKNARENMARREAEAKPILERTPWTQSSTETWNTEASE